MQIDNKLNIGNFDKFYSCHDSKKVEHKNFSHALDYSFNKGKQLNFNYLGMFEVLSNHYMMADTTIINEIKRTPWLSNLKNNSYELFDIPKHGSLMFDFEYIAENLFELLRNETISAIGNSKKVGILLSGGMDSRFVAGILYDLIKTKSISIDKVVAYTWGEEDSRDYNYAKIIAKELGWEFKSYKVGKDALIENIHFSSERGCEYSCLHLHSMPSIGFDSKLENIDIILAGSYGDSIGRAEYAGKHVSNLIDYSKKWKKFSYLISTEKSKELKNAYIEDINKYRSRFDDRQPWQIFEIERQCHYMRRMLNTCMETINDYTPVYQLYTHPSVYSFMWSLDVSLRNDFIYLKMLKKIEPVLMEIPWARTGLAYGKTSGISDSFKRSHHRYFEILNFEIIDFMESTVMETKLFSQNRTLKSTFNLLKKKPYHNNDILERISYLTGIALFYKKNSDYIVFEQVKNTKFDNARMLIEFTAKKIVRKFKNK